MPEATVEVLTAEVRALMIGSRQVTLSVYRQLDDLKPEAIEPFGRVRSGEKWTEVHRIEIPYIAVVGRVRDGYRGAGALARARVKTERQYMNRRRSDYAESDWDLLLAEHRAREEAREAIVAEWKALPLIVLAGLR